MPNARTNSLHDRLEPELRAQVERDLVEQPPGRASYKEVFEFHDLAKHGVSERALARWGGYLRSLARDQQIRTYTASLVGGNLSPAIQGLIRSRLAEAVMTDELSITELMKASIAERNVSAVQISEEQWRAKRAEIERADREADREQDPAKALANLRERVREVFGIGEAAA